MSHVADTYGIDVGVKADKRFAGSHVAQYISHGIDLNLVKVQLSHLFGNAVDVSFLIAALTGNLYDVPQEIWSCLSR